MKYNIRKFNDSGIDYFRVVLQKLRDGRLNHVPQDLLSNGQYSDIIELNFQVELNIYSTKEEFIKHVADLYQQLKKPDLLFNKGFWSWLAAFYFDTICPINSKGIRNIGDDNRYILNPEEYNRYYRHLVASPCRLLLELGDLAEIYLSGYPNIHGDLLEQLGAKQEIATSPGIIETATRLYWDKTKKTVKIRARNHDIPGGLRRFVRATIPQFQMTYDLNAMSGNEIIQLLPSEYDEWLNKTNATNNA